MLSFLVNLIAMPLLLIIFAVDLFFGEIPFGLTLWPAAFFFFLNWIFHGQTFLNLLLGVVVGGGFFLLQYLASKGAWIGGGDVGLGIFMGALLGWPQIVVALLASYVLGGMIALVLFIWKKKRIGDAFPFGTCLTLGTFFAMMWGEKVLNWYVHLLQ